MSAEPTRIIRNPPRYLHQGAGRVCFKSMNTKDIKLGKLIIGESRPAVIIAEIACEHGGDMETAKRLVRSAKEAGADVAKFQLHIPELEMVPKSINFWAGDLDEILAKVNLGAASEHRELMAFCENVGIQYLCTPFCSAAADILEELGVPAFKTGSGELTDLPMIRHIAKKGKPMIVSTGMCTMEEIEDTVKVLKEENADFVLMNCTSEYPAKYEHLNLGLIKLLKDKYGVMVGHSDHTTEIYSALAAVALGAKIIEKHFTIRSLHGPDDLVSLDPVEFRDLVESVRKVEAALGSDKKITEEEAVVRDWAHHSIVSNSDIKVGEPITLENTRTARPGRGIPARYLDKNYSEKLLGKKVKYDLPKNTILKWDDLS